MTGAGVDNAANFEGLRAEVSETTYKMLQAYDALKLWNLERQGGRNSSKIVSALCSMYEVLTDLLADDLLGGY